MCDHCSTYKPLLEKPPTGSFYPSSTVGPSPSLYVGPPSYTPATTVVPAADSGCCSWARDCCGGGCCTGARCCMPPEPILEPVAPMQQTLNNGYGYGLPPSSNQSGFPSTMAAGYPREENLRVQCVSTKKEEHQLPKCFGGDCQDSEECGNDVAAAGPKQSHE
ncbi:uncharacterized protein LOC144467725 [Augochlora pura]